MIDNIVCTPEYIITNGTEDLRRLGAAPPAPSPALTGGATPLPSNSYVAAALEPLVQQGKNGHVRMLIGECRLQRTVARWAVRNRRKP